MQQVNINRASLGGSLDTFAQSGTKKGSKLSNNDIYVTTSNGSNLGTVSSPASRAKRKTIGVAIALNLIAYIEQEGIDEERKQYWNTYHCLGEIKVKDGVAYGQYCKNRFCPTCNGIRKAELINKYYPILKQWKEPYFVTLTVKAVKEKELNATIDKMLDVFDDIKSKHKKRFQRGNGIKLVGVKSLECNFNPEEQTYNPHFHLIVESNEMAKILIVEWLKRWGKKHVSSYAQHKKKITNLEKQLVEQIKYGTKIFTEPDVRNKQKKTKNPTTFIAAFYTILQAMKGRRVFDRFGFNLPKAEPSERDVKLILDYKTYKFTPELNDWQEEGSDVRLANYILPMDLEYLLQNAVDFSLK